MGNCVTVYKNKDPADMNLSAQIQSPTKENSVAALGSMPQPTPVEQDASFRNLSKTENFFDSQPWLESDCEDFFSVDGDSSSCGNSPNHQKSLGESSLFVKNLSMDHAHDKVPEHSPTERKKLLIELFRESFDDDNAVNNIDPSLDKSSEGKPTSLNLPPKSTIRSPYESIPNSVHSSEATPTPYKKERSAMSTQCCLPSLVRNMSFGERKKRLSPSKTDDGS